MEFCFNRNRMCCFDKLVERDCIWVIGKIGIKCENIWHKLNYFDKNEKNFVDISQHFGNGFWKVGQRFLQPA